MTAAEEKEWGWTAGKLHHCQERPICRNKGLHLSCQTLDLTQQLHLQQHPLVCQASCWLSLLPASFLIPRAVGTLCKRWVTQIEQSRGGATSKDHKTKELQWRVRWMDKAGKSTPLHPVAATSCPTQGAAKMWKNQLAHSSVSLPSPSSSVKCVPDRKAWSIHHRKRRKGWTRGLEEMTTGRQSACLLE